MNTQQVTPTIETIARRLVELCRKGEWETAQRELFAENAVSIEPYETPMSPRETRGLEGIFEKGRKFEAMVEQMHGLAVSDPLVGGNAFACRMEIDATFKGQGRMQMNELCVYDVKDGRIVAEQFHH